MNCKVFARWVPVTLLAMVQPTIARADLNPRSPSLADVLPHGDDWTEDGAPRSNVSTPPAKDKVSPATDTGDTWTDNEHSVSDARASESEAIDSAASVSSAKSMPLAAAPQSRLVINLRKQNDAPASGDSIKRSQWPVTLPYVEGLPAPSGYTLDESRLNGLIIGGIIPLSVFYFLSLAAAESGEFRGPAAWLALPVVGPYGWLVAHGNRQQQSCSGDVCFGQADSSSNALVTFDAVVQTASAAMFITGLAVTRRQWVLSNQVSLMVAPYVAPSTRGLSMLCRF